MNNSGAVNYDDRSASKNLLHHTPLFLVVLCIGILEN